MKNTFFYKSIFYIIVFCFFFYLAICQVNKRGWDTIGYDTWSYFDITIDKPWEAHRSPGVLFYYKLLHADNKIRCFTKQQIGKEFNPKNVEKLIKKNYTVNNFFVKITLINCFLLSISLTFFVYALSVYLDNKYKFAWRIRLLSSSIVLFSIFVANIIPMNMISSDPIAQICTPLITSFLLLFFTSHRLIQLFSACFLAAFSFLVRPAFAFFPLLCGTICCWELIKSLWHKYYCRALNFLIIGLLLSIMTIAWPIWLYSHGDIFVPSQLSAYNNMGFAFHLVKPEDENIFADEKQKEIVKKLLIMQVEISSWASKEDNIIHPPTHAWDLAELQRYYRFTLNPLIWNKLPAMLGEYLEPAPYYLSLNRLVASFAPAIIRAHWNDYLKIVLSNFMGAFKFFPANTNYAYMEHTHIPWISDNYSIVFFIILLSFIFGCKRARVPILLFVSIHVLHMFICAIGSCMENRYVDVTEFLILTAFFLSLLSLLLRLRKLAQKLFPNVIAKIFSWPLQC